MSSLVENLETLKKDLAAKPPRIAAHQNMPFAIFRYCPAEEYTLRKQLRLLSIGLQQHGRHVRFISLARLVWAAVREHAGSEYLFRTEILRGFPAAEQHLNHLLSSEDFSPIEALVVKEMAGMDPARDVAFLVRAGGFAPGIFRASALLDNLHLIHQTMIPVVLFYPGSAKVGTDLRFYDIPADGQLGVYNYRVKVYGAES